MGIAVLGPLEVDGGNGALARRDRVVLAVLAMRAGEPVAADQLADALWAEGPPPTWPKVLQGSVVRLRKLLGAPTIETVGHGYRLALPASDVDAQEFERLVGRARVLLERGEPDRAAYAVGEALELWRGDPLSDLEEWEPGHAEAERLRQLHLDVEELAIDAALRSGRHRDVLADARRLVEAAPLRERRWELLALAQYRSGQQADALRTLQQLRRVLVTELGLDPSQSVTMLEQAILRQDPALLPRVTVVDPSDTCPYLGLVPYGVGDAETYFGRQADVEACRRRLATAGVVAVVGPSGSGKSSLVRAGLAAALERDGERVVVLTPGRHPLAALRVVPEGGRPVVLVVDQAEEAESLCEDPAEVAQFFESLADHASRGGLVLALRADRLGDLAPYGAMARLVENGLHLLAPMTAEALRTAIEGPARQAGLRLEPGLVELLVAEVEGQPGALPLLSHALRQTWERREGGVLTLEGYRATGGIRQAVAQSAERVYDDLPADQRTMLRDLMLRLVTPGPEGAPMRSPVPRRLLTTDRAHEQLMERLVAARLVTSADGVVELAHEALARAWPRLQEWLEDDTEGQRVRRHLSVAADSWDAMGRPDDELYRGARLAQALDWRERSHPDLAPVEVDYLTAADHRVRAEEESVLERARYQSRVNRRLRGLLFGAALLLAAATVAGTLAVRQANRASEASVSADARRVAAQAQLAGSVDRSLTLAAAAQHVEESPESRAGLLAALARIPQLSAVRPMGGLWLEVSPDGRTIVTLDGDHRLWFHDASTLERVGGYDPYPDRDVEGIIANVSPLAYTSDGARLAVGMLDANDAVVRVLDPATNEPVAVQPGGQPDGGMPNDVKFSADGRYLAVSVLLIDSSAGQGQWVYLWDLTRPQQPLRRIEMPSDTFHVEFSGDGRLLYAAPGATSDVAGTGLRVYDVRTGKQVGRRADGGEALTASPDGRILAYGRGSDVVLSAATTGTIEQRLRGAQGVVGSVAFSVDGRLVAAVSDGPAAHVWERDSGRLLETIPLEAPASDVSFDAEGDRIFVPSDERLLAFDLTGEARYVQRTAPPDPDALPEGGQSRYASPYAPGVVISSYDPARGISLLRVEDRSTGRTTARLGIGWEGDLFDSHAWSPDGRHLAFGDALGRLRLVDWRTGEEVAQRRFTVRQLAYTPDGKALLAGRPGALVLLDARTLDAVTEPVRLQDRLIVHAEPGPTAGTAAVVSAQDTGAALDLFTSAEQWHVLDLRTGETVRTGRLRDPAASMAVSPDRTRMAAASAGHMEIVDLRSGDSRVSTDTGTAAGSDGALVTFSPDGELLASADYDGSVSLRDGTTGVLLGTVDPAEGGVAPIFLDDHALLLPYFDGSTYVWDTSPRYAIDSACRIVGRGLTREEWRVAFGDQPYEDVCG